MREKKQDDLSNQANIESLKKHDGGSLFCIREKHDGGSLFFILFPLTFSDKEILTTLHPQALPPRNIKWSFGFKVKEEQTELNTLFHRTTKVRTKQQQNTLRYHSEYQ